MLPDPFKPKARQPYFVRRLERIRAQVDRNRRGDYRVPTWVLGLALGLFVAGWLVLILVT